MYNSFNDTIFCCYYYLNLHQYLNLHVCLPFYPPGLDIHQTLTFHHCGSSRAKMIRVFSYISGVTKMHAGSPHDCEILKALSWSHGSTLSFIRIWYQSCQANFSDKRINPQVKAISLSNFVRGQDIY